MTPDSIDLDRLVRVALSDIDEAVNGWLNGPPQEEVALLSRITEQLGKRRWGCDVGASQRVKLEPSFAMLHRKGERGKDKFGCDLALTVRVPADAFVKTAFIQLKRSIGEKVVVDKDQVSAALGDPRIAPRAFTMGADPNRGQIRLIQTKRLENRGKSVSWDDWLSLSEWLLGWMRCELGQGSPYEDVERSLALLSVPQEKWDGEPPDDFELPEDYELGRVWAQMSFRGV